MNAVEIPAEVQQLAANLGVDVNEIIAGNPALQAALAAHAPAAGQAQQAQAAAGAGIAAEQTGQAGTLTAAGVDVVPTETPEQRIQRELAVAQQELQQTRQMMQTIQEGRVVGSSGLSGPVVAADATPNLGGIEPGLRWAVRNGLVELEKIADPLIRDLFKNDLGGVI